MMARNEFLVFLLFVNFRLIPISFCWIVLDLRGLAPQTSRTIYFVGYPVHWHQAWVNGRLGTMILGSGLCGRGAADPRTARTLRQSGGLRPPPAFRPPDCVMQHPQTSGGSREVTKSITNRHRYQMPRFCFILRPWGSEKRPHASQFGEAIEKRNTSVLYLIPIFAILFLTSLTCFGSFCIRCRYSASA